MKPNLYVPRLPAKPLTTGDDRTLEAGHDGDDRTLEAGMTGHWKPANYSIELDNLPLSLGTVESGELSGIGTDVGLGDEFDEFLRQFPFKGSMDRAGAWREFAKLGSSDRELAIRRAGKYASDCARDGVQLPRHEARWLRQREFETAQIENAEAQAVGLTVAAGTRAFDAWVKFGHKQTLTSRDEATARPAGGFRASSACTWDGRRFPRCSDSHAVSARGSAQRWGDEIEARRTTDSSTMPCGSRLGPSDQTVLLRFASKAPLKAEGNEALALFDRGADVPPRTYGCGRPNLRLNFPPP